MRTVHYLLKAAAFLIVLSLVLLSFTRSPAHSKPGYTGYAPDKGPDRALSPYFFVKSDDSAADSLPLKATSAEVSIAGVIADVRVTQLYANTGKRPLEAVYIFPASTRAAVYGMKMTIGERVIEARISKREDARREYEKARDEGRNASLLEQQRPNVFQMNVANIMPGDRISVELKYTELIVPADGVYEFMYPAVVGPRYSNQAAAGAPASEQWLENPYLHEGEDPNYDFSIKASIKAGMPVKDVSSPSHRIATDFRDKASVEVGTDPADKSAGKQDFILRYRLAGNHVQSGLLLYEGARENFFLLMVQPPKRVTEAAVTPREYIFVVDVSGSMHGFPLDISKKLMKDLVGNLRSSDRFNVLLFSGGSALLAEQSLPATKENIAGAISFVSRQTGGGGTELLPALQRALGLERAEGYSRSVVIVTDGYISVEAQVFDLIRARLGEANMFAFGIGSSVNRHLIEGMARVGMGEAYVITKPDQAPLQAEKFRKMVQSPVLTGIKSAFSGFEAYDVEPPSIPDVLAERPVIIFGKWKGAPRGAISISGRTATGEFRQRIDVEQVKPADGNSALRYLWARHRIALLGDYNNLRPEDKRVREITALGLDYNLLTAYTSFVAVDTQVRNQGGQSTTVKQPLPLPEGVSDYAIGQFKSAEMAACSPGMYFPMGEPRRAKAHDITLHGGYRESDIAREEKKDAEIRVESLKVKGSLSRQDVLDSLNRQLKSLGQCGQVSGKVVLVLKINADGTINEARVLKTAAKALGACVRSQAAAWAFSAAPGSTTAEVTISFK